MAGEAQNGHLHPLGLLVPILVAPAGFAGTVLLLAGVRGVQENSAAWTLVLLAGVPMPVSRVIALIPQGARVLLPLLCSAAGAIVLSPVVTVLTLLGISAEREPHFPHASEAAVWLLVGLVPLVFALLSWDAVFVALLARRRFVATATAVGMHLGQGAACVIAVMAAAWPGKYESLWAALAVGIPAGMAACAICVAVSVAAGWLLERRLGGRS